MGRSKRVLLVSLRRLFPAHLQNVIASAWTRTLEDLKLVSF
jgi:hypothetical protein